MPVIGKISDKQRLLAAEIRKDFDGQHLLNAKQVGQVLGVKSHHTITNWLLPIEPRVINGRKYYLALDVAGKILEGPVTSR